MCTAATYCNGDFYFGRNLDYEFSYGEHVTIMPRNYPIRLHSGALDRHHAMIGMAHIQDDYPLYYDAVNEKGLCIAGLNFVGNAVYPPVTRGVASVAQYALIPWLLGTCANIAEEIADVGIMLDQMAIEFEVEDAVAEQRAFKVRRLRERIENDA
jgi:penicillin V acylase-like amidase (Ntn superfamily)